MYNNHQIFILLIFLIFFIIFIIYFICKKIYIMEQNIENIYKVVKIIDKNLIKTKRKLHFE
jgi:hypothetical protein